MSDFQTMDDFAVFVNDYLTPEQVIVQAYSYAADQQELSLLVTIDDYEMMCLSLACCLDLLWLTPGLLSVYDGF